MLERDYQPTVIKRIYQMFNDDVVVLKNDSSYLQGVPDLIVLYRDRWALLEVKPKMPKSSRDYQPNQEYYIEKFDEWSFAAMICPENQEEVLYDLQRSFQAGR